MHVYHTLSDDEIRHFNDFSILTFELCESSNEERLAILL